MSDRLHAAVQMHNALKAFAGTATVLSDSQALQMPDLFPTWDQVLSAGDELPAKTYLTKDGQLYQVMQAVTPQAGQVPGGEGMLAVYRPVEDGHAGTPEDPIPWVYGMDCRAGVCFSYEGHVYQVAEGGDMIPCVWAPGTPGLWQWVLVE